MTFEKVVWITGLSGAGKSTIARTMQDLLRTRGIPSVIIDGDKVRATVGDDCSHDRPGRITNAYRVSRFARLIAEQGVLAIVATMSLYHEVHAWNREHLPGYFEVLLEVDLDVLKARDPKGLYRAVMNGMQQNVGGVDLDVEFPVRPDLRLNNSRDLDDVTEVAEVIARAAGLM